MARPRDDAIWIEWFDLSVEPAAGVLDEEERRRAARFVYDRDRRRFVASHTAMRLRLASYLDIDPADVCYQIGHAGKPTIARRGRDVRFNLSHSGERAVLAIAMGRDVGVDVEQHREIDVLPLMDLVCAPRERETVAAAGGTARIEAFYRCWTRKESFVKALGHGLSFPLPGVDVSRDGAPLIVDGRRERRLTTWSVMSIEADAGYSAALTVPGGVRDVVTRRLVPAAAAADVRAGSPGRSACVSGRPASEECCERGS